MQNWLISIGIAIIAAFVAALAGPHLVDWSHFRGKFETELTSLFGAPVAIRGPIEVELLPAPRFVFHDIAHVAPPEGTHFAVRGVRFGLSLTDLLRGEVIATHLALEAPEVTLVRAQDGGLRLPLRPAALLGEALSIERMTLADGQLRLADATGATLFAASALGLEGVLSAASLRLDGSFVQAGERVGLRLITSGAENGLRLKLLTEHTTSGQMLDFDGLLKLDDGKPVVAGGFSLSRSGASQRLAGRVEGGETLRLDNLDLRLGEAGLKLEGHGAFDPAHQHLRLELAAQGADLDRLAGGGWSTLASTVLGGLENLRLTSDVDLEINLTDALWREARVEQIQAQLNRDGVGWRIGQLAARLPGGSRLDLADAALADDGALNGALRLSLGDTAAFLRWIGGRELALDVPPGQAGSLAATVRLHAGRLTLDRLEAASGTKHLSGELTLAADEIAGKIRISDFELGGLRTWLRPTGGLPGRGKLAVSGERLSLLDLPIVHADADLSWQGERFEIGKLTLDGGEALQLSLRGPLTVAGSAPTRLDMTARLGREALERLLAGAGLSPLMIKSVVMLAPLDLSGTATRSQSGSTLSFEGPAAGGQLQGRAELDPAWHNGTLRVSLDADAAALARLLAQPDGMIGPSRAAATLAWRNGRLRLESGEFHAGEMKLTATPLPEAGLDLKLAGARVPGWACLLPEGEPLAGTARLLPREAGWSLVDLKADAGGQAIAGGLEFNGDGLNGMLKLQRLSADRLATCAAQPAELPQHLDVRVARLDLPEGLLGENIALSLRREGPLAELSLREGQLADGQLSGGVEMITSRDGHTISSRIKLEGAEAERLLRPWDGGLSGRMSLSMRLEGMGADTKALLRSLSGDGTIVLDEVAVSGLDGDVFNGLAELLGERAVPDAELQAMVRARMAGGRFDLTNAQIPVVVTGGFARLSLRLPPPTSGAQISLAGSIDLPRGEIDLRAILTGADTEGLGVPPQITQRSAGPWRQRITTLETSSYSAWLTLRAVRLELDKMEKLKATRPVPAAVPANKEIVRPAAPAPEAPAPKVKLPPLEPPVTIAPLVRPPAKPLNILPQ